MGFQPKGITALSELIIDVSKNWQTKNITNFGASAFDVHAKLASIISALSELTIDADKDWLGYGISNIKELAASMASGDILFRGSSVIEKLTAGVGGQWLRTLGPCQDPEWAWIPGMIIVEAFFFLTLPEPTVSVAVASSPGGGVTATPSLAVPAPSISEVVEAGLPGAVGGALADDGGDQTDETAEANSPAANDMTLLPALPAVDDAYYFGLSNPWDWLALNIGRAGIGTWTIVWEYYNGATWETLPGIYDTSNGFRNGGTQSVAFHRPNDWATSSIMLMDLYWIRGRISSMG